MVNVIRSLSKPAFGSVRLAPHLPLMLHNYYVQCDSEVTLKIPGEIVYDYCEFVKQIINVNSSRYECSQWGFLTLFISKCRMRECATPLCTRSASDVLRYYAFLTFARATRKISQYTCIYLYNVILYVCTYIVCIRMVDVYFYYV